MRYLSFTILQYRAIAQPLFVDIEKQSLVPIIGINECGKTTILHAILAFDYYNDTFNANLHHLDDTNNLYKLGQDNNASVMASVKLSWTDMKSAIEKVQSDELKSACNSYRRKGGDFQGHIDIVRNLHTKKYDLKSDSFQHSDLNNALAREIISKLPYILYFDDFRDAIPGEIEVKQSDGSKKPEGWLAIIERLFTKTDSKFSIFKLDALDDRERKSIIAKVKKALNTTLAREWQNFKLDNNDALEINLDYVPSKTTSESVIEHPRIKFEVVEKDQDDEEHYFYVRDRSKGFFWFFNFVMKLEFNPKVVSNDGVDAIYLLDEPGSYLHAAAQSKLCKKLKDLSDKNGVIYCTHSHYLLDPEVIPISSVRIASKNNDFEINLSTIYNYDTDRLDKKNAFQPIYDALQIKPFRLDIGANDKVVLTEGIYDFYCYDMLVDGYRFVPGQNADSINYYIALMVGWAVNFNAIWDNDDEGRKAQARCENKFGEAISSRTHLLPLSGRRRKTILQDLFDGSDLSNIKNELGIPQNSAFTKAISTLYYSDKRDAILKSAISAATRSNFKEVEGLLKF